MPFAVQCMDVQSHATQVTPMIDTARPHPSTPATPLERQANFMQALQEVVSEVLQRGTDETFYSRLLERAVTVIPGAQAGSIFLRDGPHAYRICATVGFELAALHSLRFSLEELSVTTDVEHYQSKLIFDMPTINRDIINEEARTRLENEGRIFAIKVTLSIPVVVAGELLAVMYFDNFEDSEAFGDEALEYAHVFASQLGLVLQRLELQAQAERRAHFQKELLEVVSETLAGEFDEGFYDRLLSRAVQVIPGAEAGSVLLRRGDRYHYVAAHGYDVASLESLSIHKNNLFFFLDAAEPSRPQVIPYPNLDFHYINEDSRRIISQVPQALDLKALLMVPVVVQGEHRAVINLGSFASEKAFNEEAAEFAGAFAKQLGLILQRLQLQAEAEERATFQRLLARLEYLLLEFDTFDAFLAPLMDLLLNESLLGFDHVNLLRLDTAGRLHGELFGLPPDVSARVKQAWLENDMLDLTQERGVLAKVARDGSAYYCPDVDLDPYWIQLSIVPVGSTMLLPVFRNRRLWGIFQFVKRTKDGFSASMQELLKQIAHGIELALSKQADREDLQQQLRRMEALVSASDVLHQGKSIREVLDITARTVLERTSAAQSAVWLHQAESDTLERMVSVGQHLSHESVRLPRGVGVGWQVLESGKTLHLPKVGQHADDQGQEPARDAGPYLAVPLRDQDGKPVGFLSATFQDKAGFTTADQTFLEAIAHACSHALSRLGFVEKSRQEARAYRALANFGATIEEINDPEILMRLGLQSLREQLGLDMATYHEVRDGYCHPAEVWGACPAELQALRGTPEPVGAGLTGHAAKSGELLYIEDYRAWPYALPAYLACGLATHLVLPVKCHGAVVKVISICSFDRALPLAEEQITIARNFVKRLENALERAENLSEVSATRESTLRTLGLMLEQRDFETKGHTDRVVKLVLRFGQELGLDGEALLALRWGAYLHDIGKVAIPDRILLKAGPLTDDEVVVMRDHALIGAQICNDIMFLPTQTRQIVRWHHEWWNGDGYPDGLSGREIPLLARMFSLVDVYDALMSTRPYKHAWNLDEAKGTIRAQAGIQFDPELTEVFLRLLAGKARNG